MSKVGKTKKIIHGTILCSFFFEHVLAIQPRVTIAINSPRDTSMSKWEDLIKWIGGGKVTKVTFDGNFFHWWEQQVMAIEDYTHVGVNNRK